jgi:hypothetical protein
MLMPVRAADLPRVRWPGGRSFAFSIFDDPDGQSLADGRLVYGLLGDLGFRTTRGIWPGRVRRTPNSGGETCDSPEYRRHTTELQRAGFEVGYHNTTRHSSTRPEIIEGLDRFREYFGHDPSAMANHYNAEAIYWGPARITPPRRTLYQMATLGRTSGTHFGEVEGHPAFWGDICRTRISYCRNFVFRDVNTLAACPWMPYYDPLKPFVAGWYASTEGSNRESFVAALTEAAQDRLEAEGGACIMYTHFGHRFVENGTLDGRFRELMVRLSRKNGWFVPVSELLNFLRAERGMPTLSHGARRSLEGRWLWQKIRHGTS